MTKTVKKTVILIFAVLCSAPLLLNANNIAIPTIGNDTSTRFSAEEERVLGETFMRRVRLELPVTDDPEISSYVQRLGFHLIANSEFQTRHFHFFVINQPSINAFAGPDGYIGINAGLILQTDNESEVASVVAHEIAHVTQRHLERTFDQGEKLTLPTAAAIIAALVLGSSDINIAEAAILTTIAANYQSQLSYSRGQELEADHVGMQILTRSEFDPHAMPAFFEKLQQNNRLNEGQSLEYLSTHPVTVKRISESRNRAANYDLQAKPSSQEYHLVKAKLRVNTSENTRRLQQHIEAELKEGSYINKIANLYAYAWTLLNNQEVEKARSTVEKILSLDRERIQYSILQARIEIEAGNIEEGLQIYRDALSLSPGNSALTLYYADDLISQERPEEAREILKTIQNYTKTPTYYQLMAKAEGNSGHPGASHRNLAEYYLQYDQVGTAIGHLKQALNQKDISERDKSAIQARIDEIKRTAAMASQF